MKDQFDLQQAKWTDELKDKVYALFMQASIGNVNTERPGFYKLEAKRQWDAWKAVEGMS
jgi:diazepam-binding inhibitor (GABA receptor modulator, acyl-CoA-binding protein)